MPSYNPNSIWGSKKEKYPADPVSPPQPSLTPPPTSSPMPPIVGKGPSFFHKYKLVFFSIGLLLALGVIGLIFYLLLPPPQPNIAITFTEPNSVVVGQPFPFSITVSNESKSVLKNAQLNISLPDGISFVGEDASQRVMSEQIDTLSSQTINPPENLQLIATGVASAASIAGTSPTISVKLLYQTAETDNTQYEADASTNVLVGTQPAVTVLYTAPSSVFSGQNFDLVINYANTTTSTLQDAKLQMQYPPSYTFVSSTLAPINNSSNGIWDLGALASNATGTFTITGNIVGPASAQYQLNGTPIVNVTGQNYSLYPSTAANFLVATSPLSVSLSLNNSTAYVTQLNDNLNYTITYKNNSNISFQGLNLSVNLQGQMFNFSSLQTTGAFNSNADSITWNAANTPQLLSLAPGQSGSVTFSINTKSAFPIRLISDKNYSLKASAQIESATVLPNTEGTQTQSASTLTTKVAGLLTIGATGYFHEPTATIKNTGSYPPVANTPTEYTIHWDLTNYSTDAQNVTVSAYLQSGTTFTGQVESNVASSTPVYNPTTGLITWTIPLLSATTGVISPPAEAIFQVTNTPSITQVGQDVTLLGVTNVSSTDAFTGLTLSGSAAAVTTQLPDDQSITTQQREVTQ